MSDHLLRNLIEGLHGKEGGGADHSDLAKATELVLARRSDPGAGRLTLAEFKTMMREQYFVLLNDEPGVLAAIPALLPAAHRRAPKGL